MEPTPTRPPRPATPSPPPRRRRPARCRCAASAGSSPPHRLAARRSSPRSSSPRPSSRWPRRSCSAPSSTTRCPQQDLRLLVWLVARHGRRRRRDLRARRRPDLDLAPTVGQQVMHRLRTDVFTPPAAPVDRLLHPHPHRRGAVPHHQRHRRHAVRRHLDRDVDRRRTSPPPSPPRRHGRAVLAALAGLAGRAAAGDLPDPPGRADAPRRSPRSAQRELADLNVTIEEGLSISGVQLSKTHGHRRRAGRPLHRVVGPPDRPGAALRARRPLADGRR